MFKKLLLVICIILIVPAISIAFNPWDYGMSSDKAYVVIWQTRSGNWKACGPVQRTSTSWESLSKAVDLVTGDDDYKTVANYWGEPTLIDGSETRYAVFALGRSLESGEYNALRCIK